MSSDADQKQLASIRKLTGLMKRCIEGVISHGIQQGETYHSGQVSQQHDGIVRFISST